MRYNTNVYHTEKVAKIGWIIVFAASIFYCFDVLLRVSPSVMVNDLRLHYNASTFAIGNLSATYYYVYAPMQIPVGLMMDYFGPRRLLCFAGLCCALGIYLFMATPYISLAYFGRFLVGFGSSFAFVGVMKLASLWLPSNRFGFVAGITMALGMCGAVMGDLLLMKLVAAEGWRAACFHAAIIGIFITLMMILLVRDSDITHEITDNEPHSAAELYQEFRLLITSKKLWGIGLVGMLTFTPLLLFAELFGINFLQVKYQLNHIDSAHINLFIFVGWMIGGPVTSYFADKYNQHAKFITYGTVMALLLFILIIYFKFPQNWLPILFMLLGIANCTHVLVFAMAKDSAPKKLRGTAIAFVNCIVSLSGSMQLCMGWLLDKAWAIRHGDQNQQLYSNIPFSPIDYEYAYAIVPLTLIVAVIICFMIREKNA